MSYTSYKLYQKYLQYGSDAPVPAYPMEYSYNADGTMPAVVRMANDPACGEPQPLPPIIDDYSTQYLTIEGLEDNNTIYWKYETSGYSARTISVSTDDGETWTAYTSTSGGSGTTIATLNNGDKLLIKGQNNTYAKNNFNSTKQFKVYGNIMSLVSGDTFENADTLTNIATFSRLFKDATGLVDAENLVLPATTLTSDCYEGMFLRCTSLTTAPALPATTLIYDCYYAMFYGCTSLTTAPQLPATTLAENCYWNMFQGCTSLTVAPALPATTLADNCYNGMFTDCINLTTAPALPATTLTESCYRKMFRGCTSLTTAPVLSATTLSSGSYQDMFSGCTSLNYIKCLATDISALACTNKWVSNVAASGTFVKASGMNDWTTDIDGIPTNWTVQNA